MANIKRELEGLKQKHKSVEEIYSALLNKDFKVAEIQKAMADSGASLEDKGSKAVSFILNLGAVLVIIGVISFVAANWGDITDLTKILILLISMALSYYIGFQLFQKQAQKRIGSSLILLGNGIFGASIFLFAQIFNVSTNWPDGFVLWMIGTLYMASITNLRSLYVLGIIAGLIGIPTELTYLSTLSLANPNLTNLAILLIVVAAVFLYWLLNYHTKINKIEKRL